MNTQEIEYALTEHFFLKEKIVATGITKSSGIVSHECDLLTVNKNMFITEYEIKISLSDVKADLKKKHGHSCNNICRTFFVLPSDLVEKAMSFIPDKFGVISVRRSEIVIDREKNVYTYEHGYRLDYIRQPKRNKEARPITIDDLLTLYRLENMRKRRYMKNLLQKEGKIYQYIKKYDY
ncbi:MAG: hypothetical protein ACRDDY_03385 [Clostridium sp.]|uniref:hypothetical protein n=1 Tax=Clostridium sp. TaxID=1506 RepID=UPI003EE4CF04